jgi:trypsin-like peptidase
MAPALVRFLGMSGTVKRDGSNHGAVITANTAFWSGARSILRTRHSLPGRLLAAALLLVSLIQPSHADQEDETFLVYAVTIDMHAWQGYGIYLGGGLFLTAAHIIGRSWLTRPEIVIAGQKYPTRVVKEGSSSGTDLTLLAVDESLLPMRLRLRKNPLCKNPPWPGEEVVTVVPERVVHSHIISPARLPPNLRNRTSVIADVATTGNSGSGVFDARHKCLLGIMSQKISEPRTRADTGEVELHDIAKYFVPASTIGNFMPSNYVP